MKRLDGEASENRRNFLKAAGGAAVAFAAANGAFAQNPSAKSAPQIEHGADPSGGQGL